MSSQEIPLIDAEKVRQLQKERDWPQWELARRARVGESTLSKALTRGSARIGTVQAIAEAFGVPVDAILLKPEQPSD